MRTKPLAGVKKIAVLRSNSLGDYIFALPALDALDRAYPRAELVLLGKSWHAEFLANRPGPVDRVIVLPFIKGVCEYPGGVEDPRATEVFLAGLRREKFDLCCQMYGGGKFSNPLIARMGGRLTVGMKAADAPDCSPDRWVPYLYYFPEVLRYLQVAGLAGAEPMTFVPRLRVTARDIFEARNCFPGRGFAVLHPGAMDTRRRWPAQKFRQTAAALLKKGYAVCVNGTASEAHLCSRVCDGLDGAANLCGRLSLSGLAGLLSRASLTVSNDSGPLHLARAVGCPTVGIYWVGNYINAGPPELAGHRSHISWQLECPDCGTNCIEGSCPHRSSFVSRLPAQAVIASCLELLET